MSQAPSTLGTITTSSLSPISPTSVVRSSSTQGLSSELTRVQSAVWPKSDSCAALTRPWRAASLRSTGIASSRLPSRMSVFWAIAAALATIFSLEKSRKWIIRDGVTGISVSGSGAPIASGWKKSLGFRKLLLGVVGRAGGNLVNRGRRRDSAVAAVDVRRERARRDPCGVLEPAAILSAAAARRAGRADRRGDGDGPRFGGGRDDRGRGGARRRRAGEAGGGAGRAGKRLDERRCERQWVAGELQRPCRPSIGPATTAGAPAPHAASGLVAPTQRSQRSAPAVAAAPHRPHIPARPPVPTRSGRPRRRRPGPRSSAWFRGPRYRRRRPPRSLAPARSPAGCAHLWAG